MSKHNQYTLKEAIDNLLSVYKLDYKLAEKKTISIWGDVMGKMVANHTKDIIIVKGKLFVTIDSSALRNELQFSKSKIISLLNDAIGKDMVTDIIFK